jgi:hypothetical protein
MKNVGNICTIPAVVLWVVFHAGRIVEAVTVVTSPKGGGCVSVSL